MTDESIFICDPRPNRHFIITSLSGELSARDLAYIGRDLEARMFWCLPTNRRRMALPDRRIVEIVEDDYGWPDAEFCAA